MHLGIDLVVGVVRDGDVLVAEQSGRSPRPPGEVGGLTTVPGVVGLPPKDLGRVSGAGGQRVEIALGVRVVALSGRTGVHKDGVALHRHAVLDPLAVDVQRMSVTITVEVSELGGGHLGLAEVTDSPHAEDGVAAEGAATAAPAVAITVAMAIGIRTKEARHEMLRLFPTAIVNMPSSFIRREIRLREPTGQNMRRRLVEEATRGRAPHPCEVDASSPSRLRTSRVDPKWEKHNSGRKVDGAAVPSILCFLTC
ncbi:hypothetical protein [Streptomyces sp. NPDC051677]|uniref:hypothetical protein n=1 Tax=Streptomyces sp. NPDC051677 TaxID=3365669 RepID=UPI0037D78D98